MSRQTHKQEKSMEIQPTSDRGYSDTSRLEISQERLQSILSDIEAELVNSEIYRRTMAGLQTMLGEEYNTAQLLVNAVGQEAVRLTFHQFAKNNKIVGVTTAVRDIGKEEELEFRQEIDYRAEKADLHFETTSGGILLDSFNPKKLDSIFNKKKGTNKSNKKQSNAELLAINNVQEREKALHQIGQELRQARQSRSLSTEQLYRQTLVPTYQIDALESGRIDQLPEDVYIRGFIRRLGHALGLDGVAIAESLPIPPNPVKTTVSPWYQVPFAGGLQVTPVHLYVGYTALIAGAVGGLNLMSHQSPVGVSIESNSAHSPQSSVVSNPENAGAKSKPGVKSTKTGIKVGSDIAPPEVLPF